LLMGGYFVWPDLEVWKSEASISIGFSSAG
jgi:hypothetical protein